MVAVATYALFIGGGGFGRKFHRLMIDWGELDVVQMFCFLSLSLSLNSTFADSSKFLLLVVATASLFGGGSAGLCH